MGMTDNGKAMSEADRSELAGRIAAESRDTVARTTRATAELGCTNGVGRGLAKRK
jgi:hypothetical protein